MIVLDYPVRLAAKERRGKFEAAKPEAESYLEREHNARWAARRARPKEDNAEELD